MKILKDGKIKVYSSGKEMPIGRYSLFQSYLAKSYDIELILQKAKAYMQEDKFEDCETEMNNAIFSLNEAKKGVGILTYCFAILVAEIAGKQANDTTIEGLDTVIAALNEMNVTQQDIEDCVEEVKKK